MSIFFHDFWYFQLRNLSIIIFYEPRSTLTPFPPSPLSFSPILGVTLKSRENMDIFQWFLTSKVLKPFYVQFLYPLKPFPHTHIPPSLLTLASILHRALESRRGTNIILWFLARQSKGLGVIFSSRHYANVDIFTWFFIPEVLKPLHDIFL